MVLPNGWKKSKLGEWSGKLGKLMQPCSSTCPHVPKPSLSQHSSAFREECETSS